VEQVVDEVVIRTLLEHEDRAMQAAWNKLPQATAQLILARLVRTQHSAHQAGTRRVSWSWSGRVYEHGLERLRREYLKAASDLL
jgi:hypothetical protein